MATSRLEMLRSKFSKGTKPGYVQPELPMVAPVLSVAEISCEGIAPVAAPAEADAPVVLDDEVPGPKGQLKRMDDIVRFAMGGNAVLTVLNTKTSGRFTFKLTRAKKRKPDDKRGRRYDYDREPPIFVKALTGPDNGADGNWSYIGAIFGAEATKVGSSYVVGGKFNITRAVKLSEDSPCIVAWRWFFRRLQMVNPEGNPVGLPDCIQVWHEGRCACCGRPLTVPESIESGFGPICAGRM